MTTATMTPSPVSPSTSLSVARPTLAQATDPGKALRLAPNLQPDTDLLTTEGLITFGVKGSGKSNLLALLVEQLSRFFLPQLILDTEREYQSLVPLLPHGFLATAQRCPSGADILRHGLQVVVDLQSWETDDEAARALCRLIDELFIATNALAPQDRVPCIIHLDEAAYWLPQDAVSYLAKDTRKMLADAFHKLATRGRKQGLTPFLYTQSISEVAKSAIRQAGIKVLMRQTLDIDLIRYCQFIQGATPRTKKAIQAYPSGKAIVILPDGSQHRVQFYERASEHVSHTPQAQAALVKFAGKEFDASALSMRDLTGPTHTEQQALSPMRTNGVSRARATTVKEQIQTLLSVDPTLRPVDLRKLVGCSDTMATKARRAYFAGHPDRAVPQPTPVSQRIADLLAENPALRPGELAHLTGCSRRLASKARSAYFVRHPEQYTQESEPIPLTQQIYALLAENPHLRPVEVIQRTGCSEALASKAHRAYFEQHPEHAPTRKTAGEQIEALLAENPAQRPKDLMQQIGCSKATATRARHVYFERHPERLTLAGD